MGTPISLAGLLFLTVASAAVHSDEIPKPARYLIRIRFAEETRPDGAEKPTTRNVCEPSIATLAGVPAEVRVGGRTKIGDEEIDYGTFLKVRIDSDGGEKLKVSGKVEISRIATPSADRLFRESLLICFTSEAELKKTAKLGSV